jgi:hypothetical protein
VKCVGCLQVIHFCVSSETLAIKLEPEILKLSWNLGLSK